MFKWIKRKYQNYRLLKEESLKMFKDKTNNKFFIGEEVYVSDFDNIWDKRTTAFYVGRVEDGKFITFTTPFKEISLSVVGSKLGHLGIWPYAKKLIYLKRNK